MLENNLYPEDPGYSGTNLERLGMQALIQEVKAGQVDVVVAYKLDRITRQSLLKSSSAAGNAAAADLARQKHDLEREIEKVKIDMAYRERAVTDEHLVVKSLPDFGNTIAGASFDGQCELLRLLLSQVRVYRLHPKTKLIPGNLQAWSTQIRIQWLTMNLDLGSLRKRLGIKELRKHYHRFAFGLLWRRERDSNPR